MKIKSVKYLKSFTTIRDLDLPILPAFAFIGRSNVGKSSLINSLLQRKKLVKTSSTPGKTQLLNYFLVNESFYFIDLPGYGYAKISKDVKKNWKFMIEEFLFQCPELKSIFQLVDLRHKPTPEDVSFRTLVMAGTVPSIVVANKLDKLKKNQIQKSVKLVKETLSLETKPILHSLPLKQGREEIWTIIETQLGIQDEN
ncbi:MAG: GTP-binding protein [bacterium]|jgi:GTP-binding protein